MKYIKLSDSYPYAGVDVHVVTSTGKKGTARYCTVTSQWLTSNKHLCHEDVPIKWRYADAVLTLRHDETYSHLNLPYKK